MSAWNDFLYRVREAEKQLGGPSEVWYRGQHDCEWDLTPSLPRHSDWEQKEQRLFREFSQIASPLFERRTSDWEVLFDMQHYWIPTRLLDWTTVMGVAIAFILHADFADDRDGALFVLNPVTLNRLSGRDEIIDLPSDKTFDYQQIYWARRPARIDRPLAIRPRHISDRLRAQKGTFTVYGTKDGAFETAATECYRKVILPANSKKEAREFLRWANLDEYTIYPDIVGMAYHIKRKILS